MRSGSVSAASLLLGLYLVAGTASAQCTSGNCQNGRGAFDFGWSTYAGTFKDGKPDGSGVLDYGDYRYEGFFEAGSEHGRGTLFYPDGTVREVVYERGKEVRRAVRAVAFSEAEGLGCTSGDCENGRGRKVETSGAVYEGEFRDGKRYGRGHLTTPFGDVYEGSFSDNRPHGEGTIRWASGYSFSGTFVDGTETTGSYSDQSGRSFRIVNGERVSEPSADSRVQTITYRIVGDRVILDNINGIDADGRKRLVLYTITHVTRELYWTDVSVGVVIKVFEVNAPYDMDLETIRQKMYEQIVFWSRTSQGLLRRSYPTINVAPGTSAYDAKSHLRIKYGNDVWSKAETEQIRLDW